MASSLLSLMDAADRFSQGAFANDAEGGPPFSFRLLCAAMQEPVDHWWHWVLP